MKHSQAKVLADIATKAKALRQQLASLDDASLKDGHGLADSRVVDR